LAELGFIRISTNPKAFIQRAHAKGA
jgi:hypothetical protein